MKPHNFIGKNPNDPDVLEAKRKKESFNSPIGLHKWFDGIGYKIDMSGWFRLKKAKWVTPEEAYAMQLNECNISPFN